MTTPSVQYSYASGTSNTVRPTSVTYPNGRAVTFDYGTSGGIDDSASRVASLVDSDGASTHLADYSFLGLNTVVQQDSPEADLRYTLVSLTGANDPDTGDIYAGLDRFGRVQDVRWRDVSAATDLSRIQYGYDRASNRTWRANPTDPSQHYDWLYGYDGLQRLKTGNRGTLNGTQTAITNPQFGQCWTLDPTGNWSALQQSDDGTTWTMKQSRTSNPVNEITAINGDVGDLWATPRYDANGNMTTIPRPQLERPNWANLTADQWSDLTKEEWSELEAAPKFTATYDAWNRLTKLVDAGNGQTVQENQYDGRNYRTVTKTYANGSFVETRHQYYTDDWQCVEERLGSSSTPERQFVWGIRYIDDLICRDRSLSDTLDERLYACQDANWNLTAIVDNAGAVQERYEYDPYGDVTFLSPSFAVRSASSYAWETLYAGYRFDTSSSLYAVRYRFYHPLLGTWVTRDPVGYIDGPSLLMQYATLSTTDYSGLTDSKCKYYLPKHLSITFYSGDWATYAADLYNRGGGNFTINTKNKDKNEWKKVRDWISNLKMCECIGSIVIAGHGGPGSIGDGGITTPLLNDPQSEAYKTMSLIKTKICQSTTEIDIRACSVGQGKLGEELVQTMSDTTGATVSGYTDIYYTYPHGDKMTSTPGATGPTCTAKHKPYKGSKKEKKNNKVSGS